ncbi:hypothetical protein AcW1_004868 [Taiwanofungus camphoratus]|nr:hypothetical protein AcV7_003327 [Antrodia cinnamomea]KAI0940043.1 hypothetical protein AcV5_001257 [Antrodia cinnamomea]KAI0960325.1 hypothetical protein AcW1_004868 [Antrodia cinnamomea]
MPSFRLTYHPGFRLRFHRTIFTLPDLSSLSPFSESNGNKQQPQTYHERKILPYKPSQLYNLVADVESYPRFIPFCTGCRIIKRSPATSTFPERMEAELTIGFLSFKESYVSEVTCRPHQSVEAVAASSTPLFRTLSTVWRFQPASPQSPHPSRKPPLSVPSSVPDLHMITKRTGEGDSGPTLVTLDLAFSFANPVHAAVSATFFGQVSRMMVKAFEERCLDIYGPGKK